MTTNKLHYFSGIIMSLFVGTHILNHLMILFGDDVHLAFMDATRLVYRSLVGESILLIAIGIQVISGLLMVRRKRKYITSIYDRFHIYSGLYLSFFLIAHTTAIFVGRYLSQIDTNVYFGAAVVNAFPHILFFVPYYSLGIIAFFVHVACIHRVKMKQLFTEAKSIDKQVNTMIVIGILVAAVILIGLMQVEIPSLYKL